MLYPLSYEGRLESITPRDSRQSSWPRIAGLTSTGMVVLCASAAMHGATEINSLDTEVLQVVGSVESLGCIVRVRFDSTSRTLRP